MPELKNSQILKVVLTNLYIVIDEKTSQIFASAIMTAIIRAVEEKFRFLKSVDIRKGSNPEEVVSVGSEVDSVDPVRVGKAVEAIVQIVYMDLKEKAGLYFIKQLEKNAGENIITHLQSVGVDLELLQIQQRYVYRNRMRENRMPSSNGKPKVRESGKEKSLLDYSWDKISDWKFDPNERVCIVYDKDGKVLDRFDLDEIVKKHMADLTEDVSG